MSMKDVPTPSDDAFEFWVRETALNAAVLVAAHRLARPGVSSAAKPVGDFTMSLVERFETYLNTGRTKQ